MKIELTKEELHLICESIAYNMDRKHDFGFTKQARLLEILHFKLIPTIQEEETT